MHTHTALFMPGEMKKQIDNIPIVPKLVYGSPMQAFIYLAHVSSEMLWSLHTGTTVVSTFAWYCWLVGICSHVIS